MTCYQCVIVAQEGWGGVRYSVQPAVGVCGRCHVGICLQHGPLCPEHGLTCIHCALELGLAPPAPQAASDSSKHVSFWERLTHVRKSTP